MVDKGINVNAKTASRWDGWALHAAADDNHADVVQELLKHANIDVNVQDHSGDTPLDETSDAAVQTLLRDAGGN